jgi:hypothetical protein
MNLIKIALLSISLCLIGCVHAPAKLKRVIGLGLDKQVPLHNLLSAALAD